MTTQNISGNETSDVDAGAMHKDYLRERRIDRILSGQPLSVRKVRGRKSSRVQVQEAVDSGVSTVDNFEAETGWTREDANEMAAECRRDQRLYGRSQLYV
jgi:hypothetical protein